MELSKLKDHLPYQWRVQECKEYGANCVAYIDSRDVQNRLDEIVGPENWQSDYKEVNEVVYGGIAIRVNNDWVWKWDCGTESNVEKEKGEASDAFKRAAVKWGIGRFLYDLKVVKLKTIKYEKNQKFYPLNETTGKAIFDGSELTDYINKKFKPGQGSQNTPPPATTQNKQADDKPWLNEATEAFTKAVLSVKDGSVTIAQIEKKYKLSKAIKAILEAAQKQPVNN
jgi:hypothetical protein